MTMQCSSEHKLMTTNKTSALALVSARITPAALKVWEDAGNFIRLRPAPGSEGRAYRGIRFGFFGTGADNTTITGRLGLVVPGEDRPSLSAATEAARSKAAKDFEVIRLGTIAMTLSAAVGAAGDAGLVLSSERIADTVVWTAEASTAMESADPLGGIVAYSPASDIPGFLQCGNLRSGIGVVLDLSVGTATNVNAYFSLLP